MSHHVPQGMTSQQYQKLLLANQINTEKLKTRVLTSHLRKQYNADKFVRNNRSVTRAIDTLNNSIVGVGEKDVSLIKAFIPQDRLNRIYSEPNINKRESLLRSSLRETLRVNDDLTRRELIDIQSILRTSNGKMDALVNQTSLVASNISNAFVDTVTDAAIAGMQNDPDDDDDIGFSSIPLDITPMYEGPVTLVDAPPAVSSPAIAPVSSPVLPPVSSPISSPPSLIPIMPSSVTSTAPTIFTHPVPVAPPLPVPRPLSKKEAKKARQKVKEDFVKVPLPANPPTNPSGVSGSGIGKSAKMKERRLVVLLGSIKAGNRSRAINDEAMALMDTLLVDKVITKREHKILYEDYLR